MQRRFAALCADVCPEAREAARIAEERLAELPGKAEQAESLTLAFRLRDADGYTLAMDETGTVVIEASRTRDFIAGVGALLEVLLAQGGRPGTMRIERKPALQERIHYMPGHFGNSFEVCASGEMRRYLEDMALAGASGYGDWFDPNDMPDPYRPHVYHSSSMFLWRRKKEWLAYSAKLGLDNIVIVTPNVGFVDQMRPEWVGVRDHKLRVQGQVLCPSNPEARGVILDNQRRLFADLRQAGIPVARIVCAPYDDGGCACDRCQPYYPVFLALVGDIYETIRPSYPELKVDICGWWTSETESAQLRAFAEGTARDWYGSFLASAAYGVFELPDIRSQIGGMALGCFLHVGFSHDRRDVYIKSGVHIAPRRIRSVVRSFGAQRCDGFVTYNESFGDHYNTFIAGRLGWNLDADLRDETLFYVRLMFGLSGEAAERLADVLLDMEALDEERAAAWLDTLRELKPSVRVHPAQPWAFAHIEAKAELMALDRTIAAALAQEGGFELALPAMRERLARSERLWRFDYGFGVLRHILVPRNMLPEWYVEYAAREDGGTAPSAAKLRSDA
ncbi:MAG: hypothetical protein J7639_07015 [Paenibacillaceae bacterium]|nr:hypothetical protein [Paenibacillaceae bacterium]